MATTTNTDDKKIDTTAKVEKTEKVTAPAPNLPKEPLKPLANNDVKGEPMKVGDHARGTNLETVLDEQHGQFEATRAGRTDRVTVDNEGFVKFTPDDVPDQFKEVDNGEEWVVKKIAD